MKILTSTWKIRQESAQKLLYRQMLTATARTSVMGKFKSELELMYLTWISQRRELVGMAFNGRIGYIHVPNTSCEGNRELFRGMYACKQRSADY